MTLPRTITNLRPHDDDLWELDGVGADGVEHVLQLVDDGNEALHDDDLDPPGPVRKLLSSIPTTFRQDMDQEEFRHLGENL